VIEDADLGVVAVDQRAVEPDFRTHDAFLVT